MRLAAAKPCCFFRISRAGVAVVAAAGRGPWRAAAASGNADAKGGGRGDEEGQSVSAAGSSRRARLSARRRERIRLVDVVVEDGGGAVGGIGEFLRQPAGVESLLNTRALQSFAAVDPPEANTFRCTLQSIGFLGFQVAPVLDLRVTPTCHDCTVEMLSCRFEGSGSVEQQNELFSAFMSNHITWKDDGEEPCLDIDVNLEVTLEVYTKPFSMLPLSAVETPGNLLMQGLLDRLVPLLGEQLLRDYHSWVQLQQQKQPGISS